MTLLSGDTYNAAVDSHSMMAFSKHNLTDGMRRLSDSMRHAFAIPSEQAALTEEDRALLERVADTVVRRDMATPAVMLLESMAPLNFLGSQALHVLTPLLDVVVPQRDLERIAHLLERRDTLARLASLIERLADERAAHGP